MGKGLDQTLAILNGLVGDYLARTDNGLATDMAFWREGKPVVLTASGIAIAYPTRSSRLVVLVHGVMCTENIWQFPAGAEQQDYGAQLEHDAGFTPFYLRYNSGQPIADNGARLAQLLSELVAAYPEKLEQLLLIGYSMGGLVLRSACHFAATQALPWLSLVQRVIYVGTPHLGAPAERLGRVVAKVLGAIDDPYTRLIADIGNLRSSGMKDLGDADLRHEDRAQQGERLSLRDMRHPVPLLPSLQHYLIAGALAQSDLVPALTTWFGDALVPVTSATMHESALPAEHLKVLPGLGHLDIAHSTEVYAQINLWCGAAP